MHRLNYKEMQKYCNEINKYKVSCECGHKVFIPTKKDFNICSWCGKKVYRTEQIRFRHTLKDKLWKDYKILIEDKKVV